MTSLFVWQSSWCCMYAGADDVIVLCGKVCGTMCAKPDDFIVLCNRVRGTACPSELMTSLCCVAEFMGLVGGGDERIGAGEETQ